MCYVRAPSYINDKTLFCQENSSFGAREKKHSSFVLFLLFPLRQQPRSMFWLRFSTAFERNKRYRSESADFFSYAGKTKVTFLSEFPSSDNKKDYIFGMSMKRATIRYAFRPIPHGHLFPLRGQTTKFLKKCFGVYEASRIQPHYSQASVHSGKYLKNSLKVAKM